MSENEDISSKVLTKSGPPTICEEGELSTSPFLTVSTSTKPGKKRKSGENVFRTPKVPDKNKRKIQKSLFFCLIRQT